MYVDRISNTYLVLDFWSPHIINVYTGDTAIWLVQGSEIYIYVFAGSSTSGFQALNNSIQGMLSVFILRQHVRQRY